MISINTKQMEQIMKKHFLKISNLTMHACMLALLVSMPVVHAEEENPDHILGGTVSTWLELATDYVFRGESETNDGEIPSAKIAITWTHDSGFYVGGYYANNLFPTYFRRASANAVALDADGNLIVADAATETASRVVAEGNAQGGTVEVGGVTVNPNTGLGSDDVVYRTERVGLDFPNDTALDTNNKINAIIGPYIGWSGSLFDTGMSVNSFIFAYIYPDDSTSNYVEMFNYLTLPSWGDLTLTLEASPTFNEWFGVADTYSVNVAVLPSYSLPEGFTLSGSFGKQIFYGDGGGKNAAGHDPDWLHWSLGVSKAFLGWNWALTYYDTDIKVGENAGYYDGPNNNIVDDRYVLAVSRSW